MQISFIKTMMALMIFSLLQAPLTSRAPTAALRHIRADNNDHHDSSDQNNGSGHKRLLSTAISSIATNCVAQHLHMGRCIRHTHDFTWTCLSAEQSNTGSDTNIVTMMTACKIMEPLALCSRSEPQKCVRAFICVCVCVREGERGREGGRESERERERERESTLVDIILVVDKLGR